MAEAEVIGGNTKRAPNRKSLANLKPAWKKGESGNPNGRPKKVQEVHELAEEKSPAAMRKVVHLMENATDERVQLTAALKVLEIAGAKAPEQKAGDTNVQINNFSAAIPAVHALLERFAADGSEPSPKRIVSN